MAKSNGRFQPGVTGNPGGRPKMPEELKTRLRDLGPKAVETLEHLLESEQERIRLAAAQTLLDRAYGKPSQEVALENVGDADGNQKLVSTLSLLLRIRDRELNDLRAKVDGVSALVVAEEETALQ